MEMDDGTFSSKRKEQCRFPSQITGTFGDLFLLELPKCSPTPARSCNLMKKELDQTDGPVSKF